MTTRFQIDVRDAGYRREGGASFEIKRHGTDNTIQLVIHDEVSDDTAAVLMGEREALSLGAEMCSTARRAGRHQGVPSIAHNGYPDLVYREITYDAEGTRGGQGEVALHWSAPLGSVLVFVHDVTAREYAGAWFDAEDLMQAGAQLCAESRRCGSAEE